MLLELLEQRAGLVSTNDYNRYARSAGRRAKKLRHAAGTSVRPRKGHEVQPPRPPTSWELAVVLAERAWAEAMETRSALDAAPKPAKLRTRISTRLAKSVQFALTAWELVDLQAENAQPSENIVSDLQKLEVATYASLIGLARAVDRSRWTEAVRLGSSARVGLVALGAATSSLVFSDWIGSTVDPALRLAFAHTNLRRGVDIPRAAIQALENDDPIRLLAAAIAPQALSTDAAKPIEELGGQVEWRGHIARITNADVAQAVLDAQRQDSSFDAKTSIGSSDKISSSTVTNFDEVLHAWQAAVDAAELARTDEASGEDENASVLDTYIKWNLLFRRVQRDAKLAANEPHQTRLLDSVRQSVAEMAELPGVPSDSELSAAVSSLDSYFASKRLGVLALFHADSGRWREALALRYRAAELVSSGHVGNDMPIAQSEYEEWTAEARRELAKAHGRAVLAAEIPHTKGYVSDDTRVWPVRDSPKIVLSQVADLKGTVLPVAAKPVFYDVAYNYVPSESLVEMEPALESATPKKKGLFGLFK